MKKRYGLFFITVILLLQQSCTSNTTKSADKVIYNDTVLLPGAALLFNNVVCLLTNSQKNQVFRATGFLLTAEQDAFVMDEAEAFPFSAALYPVDMNEDGIDELFVVWGNSFMAGNAGSFVSLFIHDDAGIYRDQLGFPGILPDILLEETKSYPDLVIGVPGMSFPVWGWSSNGYTRIGEMNNDELAKYKKINAETLSEQYKTSLQAKAMNP